MDSGEALDREVLVERAEALRGWLAGFTLSSRAAGALNRELEGIAANDPGSYINGQRPLAGLTIADFVTELNSKNAGVVGQVKSVGDAVIKELRAVIPPEMAAPEELEPPAPEPPAPMPEAEPSPQPRRRGRPKGSKAARNGVASLSTLAPPGLAPAPEPAAPPSADAPAQKRRGRPPRSAASPLRPAPLQAQTPLAQPAAPAPAAPQPHPAPAPALGRDPALEQLVRLWPALHPHARRAVVLYASELLAESFHGR